jgi:DNA-binding IclR family transcriptional regulator
LGASLPLDVGSAGKVLSAADGSSAGVESGWVESVGEREAGVASVSAPVLGPERVALAAVSVSGPIERTSRRPGSRYGEAVVAAARLIEAAVGLT